MTTAKNKKAAANKKSPAKAGAKKPAPKKAAAKKSVKVSAKKPAKAPSKPVAPKGKALPAKKSAAKSSNAKPVNKTGSKTAAKKTPVKPVKKVGASVISKSAKTSVKTAAPKKDLKKVSAKPESSGKSTEVIKEKKEEKIAAASKGISKTVPPSKKEQVKPTPPTSKTGKTVSSKKKGEQDEEEGPDPLHLKADKVIKELEEIMDLSKMRPRIQAGTAPKQVIVKHAHPPIKLVEPVNTSKEKFQLEFEFRSSPKILFTSLSDSSGLAGWFADEVKTKDDIYTFIWEGGESYAKLVAIRDLQLVRFQWLDDTDGTYFQFEIKEDDITSDIALVITDFANPGEKDSSIKLWESQVQNLRMLLGSL